MSFSTQSRHSLAYVPETVFGTTPASPAMARLRHTGCDLALTRSTIESDEIRSDRQISHLLPGEHSVRGDVDFELCYGGFDALIAAALFSEWTGNSLKTGNVQTSMTMERAFNDIGQYQVYTGCVVDDMSLTVQSGSLITGSFGIQGKSINMSSAPLDASVDSGSSHPPMDSFNGTLSEGGAALALAAGIDIKIENGVQQAFVLGDEAASAMTAGRSRISGELTVYFEDAVLINKFLNKSPSRLELQLTGAGGQYTILLPNILYTGAETPVKGDRVVTLNLPFAALYDGTEGTNIKITRTAI